MQVYVRVKGSELMLVLILTREDTLLLGVRPPGKRHNSLTRLPTAWWYGGKLHQAVVLSAER